MLYLCENNYSYKYNILIYFNEERHEYRIDDEINGELYTSATTLLALYKKNYNLDFWSWYKALQRILKMEKKVFSSHLAKNYYFRFDEDKDKITHIAQCHGISLDEMKLYQNIIKAEWKKDNKKSTDKGTHFHNFKEKNVINNRGVEYNGETAILATQVTDLSKLHDPNNLVIAPELMMYNREFRVSGTADKVFIFPDKNISIDDWKTNKEIKIESYKHSKMLYPLQHLDDENYNHYCLQVSLYAWMLEQNGYTVKDLKFTHVELDEDNETVLNETPYHTHYMKQEVVNMLKHFNVNREALLAKHKLYKESLK